MCYHECTYESLKSSQVSSLDSQAPTPKNGKDHLDELGFVLDLYRLAIFWPRYNVIILRFLKQNIMCQKCLSIFKYYTYL